MRKFILILICLLFVPFVVNAQAVHNGPFDAGALRSDFSNASPTASVSIKSITLSEKVKAAWAEITGNIYASGSATIDGKTYLGDETLIATTTDAGDYKIQVAGAGYITGRQYLGSSDTWVEGSSGELKFRNDGVWAMQIGASGHIGVGANPSSNYQLSVYSSTAKTTAYFINVPEAYTVTGAAQNCKGFYTQLTWANISAGAVNSGYHFALDADAFVSDANFQGTLAQNAGAHIRSGINVGGGTITDDYGLYVGTYCTAGTITNSYQLYLEEVTSTGAVTNRWGIYQDTATRKNYFNGKMMLGSTTDTGEQLQVTGDAKITGIMKLTPQATPSSPSEGWIYQDSTDHHLYVYNGTGWVQLDN